MNGANAIVRREFSVLERKQFHGRNSRTTAIEWALNKATDWVAYENEWGADLFIDEMIDTYGQHRIQIWNCSSSSEFPEIDITISGR